MTAIWATVWPVLRGSFRRLWRFTSSLLTWAVRRVTRALPSLPQLMANPFHPKALPKLLRWYVTMIAIGMLITMLANGCVEIVGPSVGTSYDLRVRVIAAETRGSAVYPAEVRTLMTADGPELDYDVTNPDGWTDGLLVPRSAERIWVLVSYQSQDGPFTVGRWVTLHRGGTDYVYEVRLDPF